MIKSNIKSAEQKFIELIEEYTVELRTDKFPHEYIYRNMEGKWLIWQKQKSRCTYIKWSLIWLFFEKEYNMGNKEIKSFMNNMLFKYLKIEGTTPIVCIG